MPKTKLTIIQDNWIPKWPIIHNQDNHWPIVTVIKELKWPIVQVLKFRTNMSVIRLIFHGYFAPNDHYDSLEQIAKQLFRAFLNRASICGFLHGTRHLWNRNISGSSNFAVPFFPPLLRFIHLIIWSSKLEVRILR